MATFTPEELALAVEIDRLVKRLNSLMRDAGGLGLGVAALKAEGRGEVFEPAPGMMGRAAGVEAAGVELKALVYRAIVVEAASAAGEGPPAAVPPHGWPDGWMG